jgi:hypothetical protein
VNRPPGTPASQPRAASSFSFERTREHVEAPEPAHGQLHECAQLVRLGDVNALVSDLATTGCDGIGRGRQLFLPPGTEHDPGSPGCQQPRGRRADTTPGTSDRHNLPCVLPAFHPGH